MIVICFLLYEPRRAWKIKGISCCNHLLRITCALSQLCTEHSVFLNNQRIKSGYFVYFAIDPLRWPSSLQWGTNDLTRIPGPQVQSHPTMRMSPWPVHLDNPKGKHTDNKQERGYVTSLDGILWCWLGQFTLIKGTVQRSVILGHSSKCLWTLRQSPHLPPMQSVWSVVECLSTLLQRWKWGWHDNLWLCISLVSQRFCIVHLFLMLFLYMSSYWARAHLTLWSLLQKTLSFNFPLKGTKKAATQLSGDQKDFCPTETSERGGFLRKACFSTWNMGQDGEKVKVRDTFV